MPDIDDPGTAPAEDPWLTLAEIAAELRVNPSTVRLWVSQGRLRASRAGQRK
jgi:excisionase family DNA binding protein